MRRGSIPGRKISRYLLVVPRLPVLHYSACCTVCAAEEGSTASVSAPVAEPKKMEGEKINLMEFAEKGRLVMRDARGEVKHVLDDDISGEIQRVQYDSGQNEIVQIGSGIEIIEFSSGSSGSGSGKMRPMKMEAAEINMMEFANKGVLVMQDVKGEVKHVLDDEKSAAIERVQYDTGQNEIVTIGSNIEVLKSTSSAELVKEKSKMKDVEKAKSTEKTQPDKKTKSTEKPQPEKSVEKTKSTEKPQPGKRSKSPPKKRSKGARKKASKERKSSSSSSRLKPKKMKPAKINMLEFADKGVLVMQDVKGEVKHALEDEKSAEIARVQYDTGQNEIVTIGSNIEVLKSSSSEVEKEKEKSKVKEVTKAKSVRKQPSGKHTKSIRRKPDRDKKAIQNKPKWQKEADRVHIVPKAMKMEAAKINMLEFAHKGVLVMQDVKGEVKHVLDDEKSTALERVQYDTGQNEIVTIGSNVEVLKVSSCLLTVL
ncbi:hypothetical protein Q1695_013235 [Nippostrongylus brasiliensis]|nr:hypothetical protein Q1695_013235 [Nippostrongylus brasiliensis]